MGARLSILHPRGDMGLGESPFGKDVANLEFFGALARRGGFEQIDMLASGRTTTARQVLIAFPVERRRPAGTGLAWMAKLGLVDWLV